MKKGETKIIDVSCALLIDNERRLFVAQRSRTMSFPMKWEFPGGKVELHETAEECLIREIQEELNITIVIIKELEPNIHHYPLISIKLIPFICIQVEGEIKLTEHANYRWLNSNELLSLDWAEADIPLVKKYLDYSNAKNGTWDLRTTCK